MIYNTNKRKLRIGCGFDQEGDYVNLDISDVCNPDIVHDVRNGLPMFEDNKFDEVQAWGILEMILPNEEFRLVLNEIWRVLKPNGVLDGQVPSTDPRVLMIDPFDRRWFHPETWKYFDYRENAYKQFGKIYKLNPWIADDSKINDNGILCFRWRAYK